MNKRNIYNKQLTSIVWFVWCLYTNCNLKKVLKGMCKIYIQYDKALNTKVIEMQLITCGKYILLFYLQTAKWYPLLHSKYSKNKPEIKLSIYLDDDKTGEQPSFKAREAPPRGNYNIRDKISAS